MLRDTTRISVAVVLHSFVLATAILLVPGQGALGQEPSAPPWVGAWHWLHETQDGRLILTEDWFCGVFGAKERIAPPGEQLSEAEAAALFRSMSGPMCGPVRVLSATADEWVLETLREVSARPRSLGGRTERPTRVSGNRMSGDVIGADGTVTDTWSYQRLSDLGTSSLSGAWELVSDEWEGLMLMTDTEYRYVMTRQGREPIPTATSQLTDTQAATLYHSYDAQGGSYSVSESEMIRRPAVAKDPRAQGRPMTVQFRLEGENLTIILTGDQQWLWRRID